MPAAFLYPPVTGLRISCLIRTRLTPGSGETGSATVALTNTASQWRTKWVRLPRYDEPMIERVLPTSDPIVLTVSTARIQHEDWARPPDYDTFRRG